MTKISEKNFSIKDLIPRPQTGTPILIIALQGIGNTFFLIPMIETLKREFPENPVEILLPGPVLAPVFEESGLISKIYSTGKPGLGSLAKLLALILKLRGRKFGVSILAFPANHPYFNLVSFFIGARFRIAHCYLSRNLMSLNFLNNIHVPVRPVHDYQQNLRLLAPLGIRVPSVFRTEIPLKNMGVREKKVRVKYGIRKGGYRIGIHPGSSRERAMREKRWAPENFRFLISKFQNHLPEARIFLFFGPDELELAEEFRGHGLQSENLTLVTGDSLIETMLLVRQMSFFVANDSGLMNMAAALGVKTLSIAGGPTDPVRTRPWGNRNTVLFSDIHCYPCRGLSNIGKKFKCIYKTRRCLESIDPAVVWEIINNLD